MAVASIYAAQLGRANAYTYTYITGTTDIASGSDLGTDFAVMQGGQLRYTTADTGTLSSKVYMDTGTTGTISVVNGGQLTVNFYNIGNSTTLTLGASGDTGTIVITGTASMGASVKPVLNIASGTTTFDSSAAASWFTQSMQSTSVATGSTLALAGYDGTLNNLSGAGTVNGGGGNLTIDGATFSGLIENVGTLTVTQNTATLTGTMTGVNALDVSNGAALTIDSTSIANEFVNVGSVTVDGSSSLDFGADNVQLNDLQGAGTVATAGTLTVNGGNYSGSLLASGGLVFTGTTSWSGSATSTSAATIASGATLTTTGGSAFSSSIAVAVNGTYDMNDSETVGALTGSGAVNLGSGQQLTAGADNSSSTFSGDISGSGDLVKSGTGTLTLTGTDSYTGGTTVSAGTLAGDTASLTGNIADNATLVFNQTANGTFAGNISGTGSLTKSGAGTLTLTGADSYTGGTTISAGTLAGDAASLTGNIADNAALVFNQTANGAFAGNISGSGSLTKSGAGTLTLTGTDSYTGGTTVSAGTLAGDASSLTGNIADNAALVFNQTADGTFAGNISGSGTLTKSGAGTLTLTGTNSYTGGTTISAGTLVGTTSSLTGDVTDNAALVFNQTTDGTFAGSISGSGSFTKSGAGTLTLTGTDSYTGGTTVSAGTLVGTASSLTGDVTDNAALTFNQTTDGTFSGNISGSGSLTKSGAGTLTLAGTGSYTGGTTISAGTLAGTASSLTGDITDDAALVFDQATRGTFSGTVSGSGTLTKSGAGDLKWAGTGTFTGGTTVTDGTLSVNGSLSSPVTVETGGTLGGSGTLSSFLAESGSFVAPGNSIGTLHVTGNAVFGDGSTYLVQVDSSGRSDLVAASGTATIGTNVAVEVSPENGTDDGSSYGTSKTYTIVSADGGISGKFASVSDDFAYLTSSLSYDPTHVYLTLDRVAFDSLAGNTNQQAVADAIEALGPGTLFDTLLFLRGGESSEALNALSGQIHASLRAALLDDSHDFTEAALRHLSLDPAIEHGGVWTRAYGRFAHEKGTEEASPLDDRTAGFFIGRDLLRQDGWRLGIMGGYGNSHMALDDPQSTADIDSVQAGVYGGFQAGNLKLRFGDAAAVHAISTRRSIDLSTYSGRLSASYLAATVQGFGEAAYDIGSPAGRIEPFADAELVYQRYPSFQEGGGAAALSGAGQENVTPFTTLGLRFDRAMSLGATKASLEAEAGWRHAYGDVGSNATLSFAGGAPFRIAGVNAHKDSVNLGIGLTVAATRAVSISIDCQSALSAGGNSETIQAGLSVRF